MYSQDWQKDSLEDQELVGYTLGFCYGDGHVTKHRSKELLGEPRALRFQSTDLHIIQTLTDRWGIKRPITVNMKAEGKYSHCKKCYENYLPEDVLRVFLSHGLNPDKDKNKFPGHLSPDSMRAFLLGFLDSDGHINVRQSSVTRLNLVQFLCRSVLAQDLQKYLQDVLNLTSTIQIEKPETSKVSIYNVTLSTKPGFKLLYNLYENATLYLYRKKGLYLSLDERYWRLKDKDPDRRHSCVCCGQGRLSALGRKCRKCSVL